MIMDSSTIAFVGTALVVFVFLKWMISPIPQPHEFTNNSATLDQDQSARALQQEAAHVLLEKGQLHHLRLHHHRQQQQQQQHINVEEEDQLPIP